MKNLFLFMVIIAVVSLGFVSCNDDDEKTTKPTKLPVVIDYSQIEMTDSTINVKDGTFVGTVSHVGGDGTATYTQDGLEVEVKGGAFSNVYNGVKTMWLYPAVLTIRNIDSLDGLSKISFLWYANNTPFTAILYDKNGNVVDEKNNNGSKEYHGTAEFTTNLDKASYLVIEGYENSYSEITFE